MKLGPEGIIISAIWGLETLEKKDINELYFGIFNRLKWPESQYVSDDHWVFMTSAESYLVGVVCMVTEAIKKGQCKKTYA